MERMTEASPRLKARIAGKYLLILSAAALADGARNWAGGRSTLQLAVWGSLRTARSILRKHKG